MEEGIQGGGVEGRWRARNQSGGGSGVAGDGGRSGLVMRGCAVDVHYHTVSLLPWPRVDRVSLLLLAPPPEKDHTHTHAHT